MSSRPHAHANSFQLVPRPRSWYSCSRSRLTACIYSRSARIHPHTLSTACLLPSGLHLHFPVVQRHIAGHIADRVCRPSHHLISRSLDFMDHGARPSAQRRKRKESRGHIEAPSCPPCASSSPSLHLIVSSSLYLFDT